jgi:hypothetical protein
MKDKISCDLEDLLNEDGFMLSRKEERFYIAASSKRARELV